MKYKIIALLSIAIAFATVYFVQNHEPESNRYHQHLQARHYTPCTHHGDEVFCTHLPIISIKTDGPMPEPFLNEKVEKNENRDGWRNYERVEATVSCYDSPNSNNHLTDKAVLEEKARVRYRGASSRELAKKGYAVSFCEEDGITTKDVSLSGMAADDDWALHGPFMDKTMIRNYMWYNISSEIMEYAPEVRFCELFVNEEYQGLYLIVEKIKRNDEGRLKLEKSNPKSEITSFIGVIDRKIDDPTTKIEPFSDYMDLSGTQGEMGGQFEILYPSKTLTQAQHDYVESYISKMEKAIYSFDYRNPKKGFRAYLDEKSFTDYYIINEFTSNFDAMKLSTYFYKDVRGKLKLAVWDFNATFFYSLNDIYKFNTIWYKYLFKDEKFTQNVVNRYKELRTNILSEEYLIQYIDDTLAYLGPAIQRNQDRWKDSYGSQFEVETKLNDGKFWTHEEAVKQLKEAIKERGNFLDKNIENLYILCHDSMNKKYNYVEGRTFG